MHERYNFTNGQKLHSIYFGNKEGSYFQVGMLNCVSIEVVMENGQMNHVPWALVTHDNGLPKTKWNMSRLQGCQLMPEEGEDGYVCLD